MNKVGSAGLKLFKENDMPTKEKTAYELGWNHRLGLNPDIPELGIIEMEEFLRGYRDCNILCYEEVTKAMKEHRSPKYPQPK
jgi:hypothetical protein